MPTFEHRFEDAAGAVTTGTVTLDVRQIEDAGVLEILQTPGSALGSWQFLGALLDPNVATFSFMEPLGHAREVKTAVSGLFGRFVARAYATRHLGLSHFVHVRKPPMRLSGIVKGELRRVAGRRGDMPDWVAWGAAPGLAIVEAKGCHDAKGPDAALARAYAQAERGEIRVRGRRAPFKRFAIATRWGFTNPSPSPPILWVKDPAEEGEVGEPELNELRTAMDRWHAATLLAPLGLEGLAKPLFQLARVSFRKQERDVQRRAFEALGAVRLMRVEGDGVKTDDLLVGGFVTPAGPIGGGILSADERRLLHRLGMSSAFVGLELGSLKRAIWGRAATAHRSDATAEEVAGAVGPTPAPGRDGAGSWVVRLDDERTTVEPA